MLSPVFWLSLVAVFWGMKWIADGLLSLAGVKLRRHPAGAAAERRILVASSQASSSSTGRKAAAAVLDRAA